MDSCKTCKNFVPDTDIIRRPIPVTFGECRKNEPEPAEPIWPIVHECDVCGEHQKRSNQ